MMVFTVRFFFTLCCDVVQVFDGKLACRVWAHVERFDAKIDGVGTSFEGSSECFSWTHRCHYFVCHSCFVCVKWNCSQCIVDVLFLRQINAQDMTSKDTEKAWDARRFSIENLPRDSKSLCGCVLHFTNNLLIYVWVEYSLKEKIGRKSAYLLRNFSSLLIVDVGTTLKYAF